MYTVASTPAERAANATAWAWFPADGATTPAARSAGLSDWILRYAARIVLDRTLWTSVVYPADYGFVIHTLGRDGDPVDALVLVAEPTFPGCVIKVEPVGVFDMHDEKGEDDKVLCVPFKDPKWSRVHDIGDIRVSLLDEIAHFFDVYKDLESGAGTEVGGWRNRAYA